MDDEMEVEEGMTEGQAQRFVKWAVNHGKTREEAYEGLAYIFGVTLEQMGIEIEGKPERNISSSEPMGRYTNRKHQGSLAGMVK